MSAPIDNDPSPLAALLAQTPLKPTALDDKLLKFSHTQPSPSSHDRIIVLDSHPSSDQTNIGLGFRQPSFNSLTDVVVTKAGNVVSSDLPQLPEEEDPVIVFESHSSDNDAAPIGLSVRQPSFVSLHGQIIPKGSDSLAGFTPIIEEVTPLPAAQDVDEITDEDDPQVLFIHELKAKNTNRWKQMGYEPPEDLIPLARAASQAIMMNNLSKMNATVAHSQGNLMSIQEVPEQKNMSPIVPNEEVVDGKRKSGLKRSNSFGMKLGEAQNKSVEMMHEILGYNPTVKEMEMQAIDENVDENENDQIVDNTEIQRVEENEEEEISELPFGRLADLDPEFIGVAYQTILTGNVNFDDTLKQVRQRLRAVAEVCADRLWLEETAYINQLLEIANQTPALVRKLGFRRADAASDIMAIEEAKKKEEERFDALIMDLNRRLQGALDDVNKEYKEAADKLDNKYQNPLTLIKFAKPSKELLNMRYRAKRLLKQNQIEQASILTAQIKELEIQEEKIAAANIREKYHSEDRKLKEEYASKRSQVIQRFDAEVQKIKCEKENNLRVYDNMIYKINCQINEDVPYKKSKQTNENNDGKPDFLEIGQLSVKPPKKLQRENDILILDGMTEEIINNVGGTPRFDIEKIFRRTLDSQNISK